MDMATDSWPKVAKDGSGLLEGMAQFYREDDNSKLGWMPTSLDTKVGK